MARLCGKKVVPRPAGCQQADLTDVERRFHMQSFVRRSH